MKIVKIIAATTTCMMLSFPVFASPDEALLDELTVFVESNLDENASENIFLIAIPNISGERVNGSFNADDASGSGDGSGDGDGGSGGGAGGSGGGAGGSGGGAGGSDGGAGSGGNQ